MSFDDEKNIKKRFAELAERAYQKGIPMFTGFLGLAEQSYFHEIKYTLPPVKPVLFGGYEEAERLVAGFGVDEDKSVSNIFPIECIKISSLSQKFAEKICHRDVLGSLMGLGIERSTLGDIIINDENAYVFCLKSIADFIIDNLTQVRRTSVRCEKCDGSMLNVLVTKEEAVIQAASDRIDGIIAKVYHLSRGNSDSLFLQGKVFINGRLCDKGNKALKEDDIVSVRGFGKFIYKGQLGISKKGKLNIKVLIYI